MNKEFKSIVMLGATGAVGGETLSNLMKLDKIVRITLLGRNKVRNIVETKTPVEQHTIDIFNSDSYKTFLSDHNVAICTLGVGEPSKISREEFLKVDKEAVIEFAKACKKAGIEHFELLASVGANSNSSNYYLKAKGELIDALHKLEFDRLSIFEPSMILTPKNRYGFLQGVILKVWPFLHPLLVRGAKKYRGIPVEELGKAIALNIFTHGKGAEKLHWQDFKMLIKQND